MVSILPGRGATGFATASASPRDLLYFGTADSRNHRTAWLGRALKCHLFPGSSLPWRGWGAGAGLEAQPRGAPGHWQPTLETGTGKEEPSRGFSHFAGNKSPVCFLLLCCNQAGMSSSIPKVSCTLPYLPPLFLFWCLLKVIWKGKSWVI